MASSSLWRGSSGGAPGGSAGGGVRAQARRDRRRSPSSTSRSSPHILEHTRGDDATHDHWFSSRWSPGLGGGLGMWPAAAGPPHASRPMTTGGTGWYRASRVHPVLRILFPDHSDSAKSLLS